MVLIKILCVGSLTEIFYKDMQNEFLKRLSRYAKVTVTEVPDEKNRRSSPSECAAEIKKEGERILSRMDPKDYNIALTLDGISPSSEELAVRLSGLTAHTGRICFIIGGSMGLSGQVLDKCQLRLSLSRLTFTHNIARLILLEQLYRSFKINEGAPYHK